MELSEDINKTDNRVEEAEESIVDAESPIQVNKRA